MTTKTLKLDDLRHFTGSEQFFRHSLCRNVIFTEGVRHLDRNGAGWLVDKVATLQTVLAVKAEPFQTWELTVKDGKGLLTCTDGGRTKDGPLGVYSERIDFTDFPEPGVKLFAVESDGLRVVMLPSEY